MVILFLSGMTVKAQDVSKYLGPGGRLTPEAQKLLLEGREFKTLTSEEVEGGRAELERRERERGFKELEKEREREKEARRIGELSNQERELRYILNKYRDRAIRHIYSSIQELDFKLSDEQLAEPDLELIIKSLDLERIRKSLDELDLKLIDILDRYEEDVIRDITNRFQLKSALYRDSNKKLRDMFVEKKREIVAQIKEFVFFQIRQGEIPIRQIEIPAALPPTKEEPIASNEKTSRGNIIQPNIPVAGLRAAPVSVEPKTPPDPIEKIFQDFTNGIIKEILDNFTLLWPVKEILPPYAKPVEELKLFGHEVFSRLPGTFAPPTSIPVSEDYLVGPGDEIKVLMWGRIDAEYTLVVDRDGTIQFPRIGAISVGGLTYRDMKEMLKRKAESMTGVNISVTMGRFRSITVFIVGEVRNPGAYTVSAFDTLINALIISGGPTDLGSLRNVQLKRNDKIITSVDFYDFLLKGETTKDRRLQSGDVVFVPKAENLVVMAGNVKRPAIYEPKGDLRLNKLIELAGGLAPSAYRQRLQIQRSFENEKKVVLDVSYDGGGSATGFILQDGDIVEVFSITPEKVDAVYVYGNLVRPGSRAYRPGMRVSNVIRDEEDLKSDTDFTYALIKRYVEPDMHTELIPFNLGRAILARDQASDINLQPYDEIYIFSKWLFNYKRYAMIKGEVRNPGPYPIDEKMRIKDLVIAARGLGRGAYLGKSHLYRTDPKSKKVTLMEFRLDKALENDPTSNLLLEDQDEVVIHNEREYLPEQTVSIEGQVNRPGEYQYAPNMRIRDLILVGGNVKEAAYLERAELFRYQIREGKQVLTELMTFNLRKALAGDPDENLTLQRYDIILVKAIPRWLVQKTVTLQGEVRFPGTYTFRPGETLSSALYRASGFTAEAYLRGSVFTRESARVMQEQRLQEMRERLQQEIFRASAREVQAALSPEDVEAQKQFLEAQRGLLERLQQVRASGRVVLRLQPLPVFAGREHDVVLEDGDVLTVPPVPGTVNVLGQVFNPTSLIYDEKHPEVRYYLARTGGPTKYAEEKQIYVIRADGSVVSKEKSSLNVQWDEPNRRWGLGRSFYSVKLYPGDTILVPEKVIVPSVMKNIKDITQILANIAITAGVLVAAGL
jgi:protein involved in polysaccharide export with SLBB domain